LAHEDEGELGDEDVVDEVGGGERVGGIGGDEGRGAVEEEG
jgi:hypothetical protein